MNHCLKSFVLSGIFIITSLNAMDISELSLPEAVKVGNLERVKQLLNDGANVNQTDNEGLTPLYRAIEHNNVKMAKLLLKHQADVNNPIYLLKAIDISNEKMVELLGQVGAKFYINKFGNSPLFYPTVFNKKQIAIILIFFYGKSILSIKNNKNKTVLDIVALYGHQEIEQLFTDVKVLDTELEKLRAEFFKKKMKKNCQSLNPVALLAGREIGRMPLQIKLEQHKYLEEKAITFELLTLDDGRRHFIGKRQKNYLIEKIA